MKAHLNGRLDAMFLCHGVVNEKNISDDMCSVFHFDQTMLVNVRTNVHLMSLAFPFMKQNDKNVLSSSITVLTSTSCNSPDPRASVTSIASAMTK